MNLTGQPNKNEDSLICVLLSQNEIKGIELLFQHYFNPLVIWANHFTGDSTRSKDLVQDTFVEIWEKKLFHKFQPQSLGPFLRTLVRHKCISSSRKKDTLSNYIPIEKMELIWDEYTGQREEILPLIRKEIEMLPPRSREIVDLVYSRKMKYQEAADLLGISVNTVKTLLRKSLEQLRNKLQTTYINLLLWYKKRTSFDKSPV